MTERAIAAVAAAGALVAVAVVGSAAVGPATAIAMPRRPDYQVAAVERVPAIRLAAIDAARSGRAPYRAHLPFAQLTGPLTPAETRVDASLASAARSTVAAFERRVEADVPPASLSGTRRLSTLDGVVTSNLVSSTIISFTVTVEASMAGAAHGLATVSTTNDSLVTGRSLQLAGLFRPGSRWLAALSARSRHVLGAELGLATTPQMLDPGTAPVASNFSAWALTPFGLAVTFQDYQVSAYVAGTPMLTIPYAALAGIARRGGPMSKVAADPPRRMLLLPADRRPVVTECSEPVHYLASSVPVPSTCASGQINVVSWDDLVAAGLRLMALPADASAGRVRRTMCADVAVGYEGSDLLEEHAEALVARYYGWDFGAAARHGFPRYCARSRTR